jgi:hypothetical protein
MGCGRLAAASIGFFVGANDHRLDRQRPIERRVASNGQLTGSTTSTIRADTGMIESESSNYPSDHYSITQFASQGELSRFFSFPAMLGFQ